MEVVVGLRGEYGDLSLKLRLKLSLIRCGNVRGRICVLFVGIIISLKMVRCVGFVVIVCKRLLRKVCSKVYFLLRFCCSFCILVVMIMYCVWSFLRFRILFGFLMYVFFVYFVVIF